MKPGTKVKLKDGRIGILNSVGTDGRANVNLNVSGLAADATTSNDVVYVPATELEEVKEPGGQDSPAADDAPPVEPVGEPAEA